LAASLRDRPAEPPGRRGLRPVGLHEDERIVLSLVWPRAGELLAAILADGPEAHAKEWAKKKVVE
jgi:hypothetical protein